MFSMVKMDVRRMLRSKSLYLAILIFLLFSGYCVYSQAKWQVINGYQVPQHLQLEAGLYSIVDYYLNTSLQYMYTFTLKNSLIIFGIFVTSFVANDYQSGFIKNKCMMCKNKNMIIWSKLVLSIILAIMIVILSFLLTTTLGFIYVKDFTMGTPNELLQFFGTSVLLYVAYFTGLSFLYRLLKTKLPSILISAFFPLGLTMVILQPFLGEYAKYTLSGVFLNFPMLFQADSSYVTIGMCLVFTAIYHFLSILVFHKRDL